MLQLWQVRTLVRIINIYHVSSYAIGRMSAGKNLGSIITRGDGVTFIEVDVINVGVKDISKRNARILQGSIHIQIQSDHITIED